MSAAFADANHLSLGDRMTAVVSGQRIELRFVGVAPSPEHIMPTMPNGLSADERRYAIIRMDQTELEAVVNLRGAINELTARLVRGADEHETIAAIDHALEQYGGRGAFGRASQPSHAHYEEHVQMIRSLTAVMPVIFLRMHSWICPVYGAPNLFARRCLDRGLGRKGRAACAVVSTFSCRRQMGRIPDCRPSRACAASIACNGISTSN